MMMGLSMMRAREKVTPKIARLDSGFERREIMAATMGCSNAIINHIVARGTQNQKIRTGVRVIVPVMQ
jgi:hypothetical protein